MSTQTYSYDFRGMNDATTPQRERIATFSPAYVGRDEHGFIWEAAPDMLAALELAAWLIEEAMEVHIYGDDETPDPECNYVQGLVTIRAAIAKATRKTA